MVKPLQDKLSRRERQIMDILFQNGESTAAEVLDNLDDPPSYSAVRALLKVLEVKGHVHHRQEGPRYVYSPVLSIEKAKQGAARHLLKTFFQGSTEQAVAALLDVSRSKLTDEDLERLKNLIELAKKEGR